MRYETSTSFTPGRDQTPYITVSSDLSKRVLGCNAKQDDDIKLKPSLRVVASASIRRVYSTPICNVQAPTCWVY